jgi:hypothetical protein
VGEWIASIGVYRKNCGFTGSEVIGVGGVNPVPVAFGGLDHDPLRFDLANNPTDISAQVLGYLQIPVGVTQKMNIGHTQGRAGGPLLGLTNLGNLASGDVTVGPTGVTIGANTVTDRYSGLGPLANRASCTEIDVIGMGGDDQNAFDFHQIPSINRLN